MRGSTTEIYYPHYHPIEIARAKARLTGTNYTLKDRRRFYQAIYKGNGDWERHAIREVLESPELCATAIIHGYRIVGVKKKEVKENERKDI